MQNPSAGKSWRNEGASNTIFWLLTFFMKNDSDHAFFQDQFDTIDLTDNDIRKLENIPLLKRLSTLLMHNNRVQ